MTLAPGQSLTLQIDFAPKTAGAVTGKLTIGSNSSTGTTAAVTLSGTGTAAANPKLAVSATSLSFGTVAVGSSTTESVTLSSTGTSAVTVSSGTVTGTGFSVVTGSFPVTLNPGSTATVTIKFQPTVAGAVSGKLTLSSNSSSGSTSSVVLTATGEAEATHSVTLSWSAPSSTTDPVAGYHIYRAVAGTTTFTLLNSTIDVQTSYVDSSVAGGTSYQYEVKSVDQGGVESAASNMFTATIP
jgi:hypothetical protein